MILVRLPLPESSMPILETRSSQLQTQGLFHKLYQSLTSRQVHVCPPTECPLDTFEHWQRDWCEQNRFTREVNVWSTSQRPARGHHPLRECLPHTLDPQAALRLREDRSLEARRRPAEPMSVPLQSPALSPQSLHLLSQANISCHVPSHPPGPEQPLPR